MKQQPDQKAKKQVPIKKIGRPEVIVYTDGACSNGKGGWAASIYYGSENIHIAGYEENTTNNRMEIMAVIKALDTLIVGCRVELFSDSKYVLDSIHLRLSTWQRNGWKTKKGDAVKNRDLWERVLELKSKHQIVPNWVRSHSGDVNNETVDSLAQYMRQQIPTP